MRYLGILHVSDTHGAHRRLGELSEADVLVHSGDFTTTAFMVRLPHQVLIITFESIEL